MHDQEFNKEHLIYVKTTPRFNETPCPPLGIAMINLISLSHGPQSWKVLTCKSTIG